MKQSIQEFVAEELAAPDGTGSPATGPAPTPPPPAPAPTRTPPLALVPPQGGAPVGASSPSAQSVQPDQIAQPQPVRIDPLTILDELAQGVLDDEVFALISSSTGALTQAVVNLHAQTLRFVLRAAPMRSSAARKDFVTAYAATNFAGSAGASYDGASPRDVPYMLIVASSSLSRDERKHARELSEGHPTPVAAATKTVFARLAPKGLDGSSFALACSIIRSDLVTVGGYLAYSEMDENATIDGREVEDNDVAVIQERIDLAYGELVNTGPLRAMMDRAVNKVAMERPYHLVRDYLRSLPQWDRKPRLKHVVRDLLRAEPMASDLAGLSPKDRRAARKRIALARRQIKKFFVGGVARTRKPGCKHDSVLILKGDQGKQKSSWFRTITPCGRFSDADMDLQDKDSILELRKNFIFEWSELSTVRSAKDWEVVKGFTARQEDTVRPPYARRAVRRLRHCVIVGTTNEPEFLSDSTGSRRWWVIEVGQATIDLKMTEQTRDQLWAEAVHLYERGYRWWFQGKGDVLREQVNQLYSVPDPWQERIADWLAQHRDVFATPSTAQILSLALQMEPARQTLADSRHVGRVMRTLGHDAQDCWDSKQSKSFKGWKLKK